MESSLYEKGLKKIQCVKNQTVFKFTIFKKIKILKFKNNCSKLFRSLDNLAKFPHTFTCGYYCTKIIAFKTNQFLMLQIGHTQLLCNFSDDEFFLIISWGILSFL